MEKLNNPKWLFIVNTLPISILSFLFYGKYAIINSLLEKENIYYWKTCGLLLAALWLLNLIHGVYLTFKKKTVSVLSAIITFFTHLSFLVYYIDHSNDLIPFSIPNWMISDDSIMIALTFLMPTLYYSLLIVATKKSSIKAANNPITNILAAISTPLISWILLKSLNFIGDFFSLLLFCSSTAFFILTLSRGIYFIKSSKKNRWKDPSILFKVIICVVLPLIGLFFNNSIGSGSFFSNNEGIIGNFSNVWFFILAVLNGILVCLPNSENKVYRLLTFIGRSITYCYTVYFFLVFLPLLPFSIIIIIVIGMGFLMLAPLMLFVIHTNTLSEDYIYLKSHYSKAVLNSILVFGFLIIPILISAKFLTDKKAITETLAYIDTPDYTKTYNIDTESISNTINTIKHHKEGRNSGFLFGRNTPYISSYFKWLVLDNLTLSDKKINTIERVFIGDDIQKSNTITTNRNSDSVNISNITTESTYDKTQNAWVSWVKLEITNNSTSINNEYSTVIDLPNGCWISDYYLFVGDKKEPGILAEKKSAMWIYSQIRNQNRDPGLLYYLSGNRVAFNVFPFGSKEVRKTGIELIHKEPIQFKIDDHFVELGSADNSLKEPIETKNLIYVSSKYKETLPKLNREPYFHFLVDVSKNKSENIADYATRIKSVLNNHPETANNAQISFVNSYVTTSPLESNLDELLNKQTYEGGFYLDRAIRTTLYKAYEEQDNTYPILVVVTDSIQKAIVNGDFNDLTFTFPESNLFYELSENGELIEHSLVNDPLEPLPKILRECQFCESVIEYQLSTNKTVYLPNNGKSDIVLKADNIQIDEQEIKQKSWISGLTLFGQYRSHILHPETSSTEWLQTVKYSFISKIMTPYTSYLVVENEAQKATLHNKEKEVLNANKSLDAGEETLSMSEPSMFVMIIIVIAVIVYHTRRKKLVNY